MEIPTQVEVVEPAAHGTALDSAQLKPLAVGVEHLSQGSVPDHAGSCPTARPDENGNPFACDQPVVVATAHQHDPPDTVTTTRLDGRASPADTGQANR